MELDGSPSSDDRATGSVSPEGAAGAANGVDPDSSGVDPEAVRDEVSSKGGSGGGSSGARYKLMSPAKLPISRSPCLTIPPGLSPTSFLESPVLLSNVKAEQSPTTGSFFKPYMMHGFASSSMLSTTSGSSAPVDRSEPRGFEFQTSSRPTSFAGISMAEALASADMSNQRGEQSLLHNFVSANTTRSEAMPSSSSPVETTFVQETRSIPDLLAESGSDRSSQRLNYSTVELQPSHPEHAGLAAVVNDRTSEDGYNWRKYGQKLVKGSEYPRSYYKCSHPNCEVKKLFERAPDGQITEIIYKGTHDHPKPQPSRRMSSGGSMMPIQEERSENFLSLTGQEDKSTSLPGKSRYINDPNVNAELSPRGANENSIEGGISQTTRLSDDVDDEEDPLAKRRKMEISGMDISSVIRPIREPRVVVQTLSDVDILDDGYRWRKYGQKVVRGNPNPRSYYKCTSIGCPVRKHVERASHDPKAVITTYEGKHNHDVPTARNSSHDASSNMNSRVQSQDYDTVSLDLGVGISPRSRNGSHHQHHQARDATGPVLAQHQIGGSNVLFLHQQIPISSHPVFMNGSMMYASRENRAEGINIMNLPPLNHS